MSIFSYNGAALVGMAGKDCVAVAVDKRLGVNQFQTISANFQRAFQVSERCFVALGGLASDVQTVHKEIAYRMKMYSLREEREMEPKVVTALVASMLYARRFGPWFVDPVVAGLDKDNKPVLAGYDSIGAKSEAHDFVTGGTASDQLFGLCEQFWKPDMDADQLFETISQCLLAAVDRDCVSGWGADVFILTADGTVTKKTLKVRQD
ncbi:unnamed protein product [Vitrella brassicaformis CCMP3155]|uniref:Proteasome subunit beta n=1 Tax=Vitrella brassicaformis (strain CCMP3155) TaxID=1169540 RepID=A0A0G4ESC4_VITBC|nr:unnamed protein product [Vitrella brassicaformis CCMP3155]|mmetsp:Transcript_4765/g.11011  ORF Transcript_4765/g.11011 Transcript_4765/m.11011 type:complete len:207 (-) Transcript_4765:256-876(-)|eukprot:CEM00817.1 unnamed protein product [Vitrella brassicaformis CCMP3155]